MDKIQTRFVVRVVGIGPHSSETYAKRQFAHEADAQLFWDSIGAFKLGKANKERTMAARVLFQKETFEGGFDSSKPAAMCTLYTGYVSEIPKLTELG